MKHSLALALVASLLWTAAVAQQPNQLGIGAMTINGFDPGVGPIQVNIPRGNLIPITISGQPNQFFQVWYSSSGVNQVGFTLPGLGAQRVDLRTTGIVGNVFAGYDPGLFVTDASGIFFSTFSTSPTTPLGRRLAVQAIVGNPASPNPIPAALTAASDIWTVPGITNVTMTSAGDNGNTRLLFSTYGIPNFTFYENTYADMYVNSDGNITFTSGDGDFTPTPPEFHSGRPRIAPFWTDLNPSLGGSVVTTVDPNGIQGPEILVNWTNLPVWQNTGGRHTFSAKIYMLTGDIELAHPTANIQPIYDCFMGVGPGNNIRPPGASQSPAYTDFSTFSITSPKTGLARESFWEWYGRPGMPFYTQGFSNVFDMSGRTVYFQASGAGSTGAFYTMFPL